MHRLVTDELISIATHDYSQPRDWRVRVFADREAEDKAMFTRCTDGTTIKEHIDHLVFDLHCRNWVRSGHWLYVSNADEPSRYQIPEAMGPYLRVAIRYT